MQAIKFTNAKGLVRYGILLEEVDGMLKVKWDAWPQLLGYLQRVTDYDRKECAIHEAYIMGPGHPRPNGAKLEVLETLDGVPWRDRSVLEGVTPSPSPSGGFRFPIPTRGKIV